MLFSSSGGGGGSQWLNVPSLLLGIGNVAHVSRSSGVGGRRSQSFFLRRHALRVKCFRSPNLPGGSDFSVPRRAR